MRTQNLIEQAAVALKAGHLVAFPTETVYGLGADATNEKAVGRIYSVKSRPKDLPLIVHISSVNQINKWAKEIPDYALNLAKEFWPGPLTLILKRTQLAKDFITGGQAYIGIRVPNHYLAQKLLIEFEKLGGQGIAAPSANKFQQVSPTRAQHVMEDLGSVLSDQDLVLDGGISEIGIESTIIKCTDSEPEILRPGFITESHLNKMFDIFSNKNNKLNRSIKHSGMHNKHYSPKAQIFVNALPEESQGLIALSNVPTPQGIIRLSKPKDNTEFAQDLYNSLRLADKLNLKFISVFLPTIDGIGESIRDRVMKAANLD
jgi:L-threonylcarbamoyladenylate synthase